MDNVACAAARSRITSASPPPVCFDWQDITVDAAGLERLGVAYADGLRLLHSRDEVGQLHIGVDAFLLIWRQLPRWRVLAAIVALPMVRQLVGRAYALFAAWRYQRFPRCPLPDRGGS